MRKWSCCIIYRQPIKSANDKEEKEGGLCGWHARREPGERFIWPLVSASVARGGYFIAASIKQAIQPPRTGVAGLTHFSVDPYTSCRGGTFFGNLRIITEYY